MKSRMIPMSLLFLLLILSLACSTVTGVQRDAEDIKETAESMVTEAVELATEGLPLGETAQAYATEVPDLKETIQAYATEAPDLQETVEAVITEKPDVVKTVEAMATEGFNMGEAPSDVPVVDESTITNFYGSDSVVSYITTQDFETVVDFYKTEMPANGWEGDPSKTFEAKNTSTTIWNQTDRQSIVIITVNPVDNTTIVAITIQAR